MDSPELPKVGQALGALGLAAGPFAAAEAAGNWWSFEILGRKLWCYNFAWRRRALAFHDLHHVVTGYPCTIGGEMQVATWEFAAGPHASPYARLFCLPLVAPGAVLMPRKVFAAYRKGRRSLSLFRRPLDSPVEHMPLTELRALTDRRDQETQQAGESAGADVRGYVLLVAASAALYLLPLLAMLLVVRIWLG